MYGHLILRIKLTNQQKEISSGKNKLEEETKVQKPKAKLRNDLCKRDLDEHFQPTEEKY
tara:strand:+ start:556 stop:732 length:177 start_codon:yes stop_codon:yes gene_type:complete